LSRALDEHPLALGALAGVVGRGREVDQHLSAREGQGGGRGTRLPEVLADGEAHPQAVALEDPRPGPGLEVASLVEHPVVGQVHLVIDGRHLAVREDRRGVVDVVGAVGEPHERHDVPDPRGELLQRGARGLQEVGLQQEVLRRVAGERALPEDHELGPLLAGAPGQLRDPARVARDVAHGRVHLGQSGPQRFRARGHAR